MSEDTKQDKTASHADTLRKKATIVRAVCVAGLFAGLAISNPLWSGIPRSIPPIPAFDDVALMPPWCSWLPTLVFLFSLLGTISSRVALRRWSLSIAALAFAWLALLDLARLQPWIFVYALVLVPLSIAEDFEQEQAHAQQLALLGLAGMYVWAGVFKCNYNYFFDVGPWFFSPLARVVPASLLRVLDKGGPFIEFALGVGLLLLRDKRAVVLFATALHVTVIALLWFGHNYNHVVLPWNAALGMLVALLAWNHQERLFSQLWILRSSWNTRLAFLFALLGPAINPLGLWPDALSFKLYYDNNPVLTMYLQEGQHERFPQKTMSEFYADGTQHRADVEMVLLTETRVPLPRGVWALRRQAQELVRRYGCSVLSSFDLQTTENLRTGATHHERFTCESLR